MADTDRNTGRKGPGFGGLLAAVLVTGAVSGGGVYYALTHDITITPRSQVAQAQPEAAPAIPPVTPDMTVPPAVQVSPPVEGLPAPEDVAEAEITPEPVSEALPEGTLLPEDLPPAAVETAEAPVQGPADEGVVPEVLEEEAIAEIAAAAPPVSSIEEAITLSPELSKVIEDARILKGGEDPLAWGRDNMGYIPKAAPGDVIPGIERVESAPDQWIVGDEESEGGGDVATRYFSVSGPLDMTDDGAVVVDGTTILLSGMMLPGPDASCTAADGEGYDCHTWAVTGVRDHFKGKQAFCSVSEEGGVNYGLCDVLFGEGSQAIDLASWMVSAGLAVAHDVPAPSLYHEQEAQAKGQMSGLWEGTFAFGGRQETRAADAAPVPTTPDETPEG